MEIHSYTAANSFPSKILRDPYLLSSIINRKCILPRHVQLSPTDKCNLKCKFCSCSERAGNEWAFEDIDKIIQILVKVGTVGVTITGGGEPVLFPHITYLISKLCESNISIGLVTNGSVPLTLFSKPTDWDSQPMQKVQWVRFSFSDDRVFSDSFVENVKLWLGKADLAFSYVLTDKPNFASIGYIVDLANKMNFTHVRIVSDILSPTASENLSDVQRYLKKINVDDSRVIYQPRNSWVRGTKDCFISLLKPMIYSDGLVYPCCGAQYAMKNDTRHMPQEMSMGHYTKLPEIIKQQIHFNGENCDVCYYEGYNSLLADLQQDLQHLDFM
jgi:MoaA/NifB/PqqE/SkfB family radical SAM enzyme